MSKIQSTIERAIEKSRKKRDRVGANASVAAGRGIDAGPMPHTAAFSQFQNVAPNPEVMEQRHIVSATNDRMAKSAYDLLRTRVAQRMFNNGWNSFLITSPGPGEGKTLTASNLAMSLSRHESRFVILVDLDLQRSSLATYFGFDTEIKAGVGEFLTGTAELSDIIYVPTGAERLAIIPNREPVTNASDLLGSARMQELMSWLRGEFQDAVLVFDMPPLLSCDDVLVFKPQVDAVLLVVAQGETDRAALPKALELLDDTNVLGVVLNKSSEIDGDLAYGY